MSRNATSSWSGYAHQGKIGLLVALKKINSLHGSGANLQQYSVEYETQEDVKIMRGFNIEEVHQVKARGNDTFIGSYTTALRAFEGCAGNNYLHTICDISNWANLTAAQNPAAVIRYPYTAARNYCQLDEIYGYLESEIEILLANSNHPQINNPGWKATVFQEFLASLDDKIRYEHQHHTVATYNIQFNLYEVAEIIRHPQERTNSKICAIRKSMYNQFLHFIEDLDANTFAPAAVHETVVCDAIKEIYGLPDEDFIQFLININPHTTGDCSLDECETTDLFFSAAHFYETFLVIMILVTQTPYKLDTKNIPQYFKVHSYLLTSIQHSELRKEFYAQQILKNEKAKFSGFETDFIITQNYTGELGQLAPKLIEKNATKFMNKKNMSFISVVNAIDILNA